MKSIALVETFSHGHHSGHIRLHTKALLEMGYQVIAFYPNPTELNEWVAKNCPENAKLLHTFEIQEPERNFFPIGRIRRTLTVLARWRQAARAIQNASHKLGKLPDLVVIPWVDGYLAPYVTHHLVDQVFPYKWVGVYHQPGHLRIKQRFEFVRRGFLDPDAVLYSPHCLVVSVHDEGIAEKLHNKLDGKPVVNFPNIADDSPPDPNFPLVNQIREKARGRKIIGLLGSLGKRKGVLTLLEVSQKTLQEDYFFIFAGEFAEGSFRPQELQRIQSIVQSNPDNCFFHFERIPSGSPFNSLIDICDVLFIVYENYTYSSQVLTEAAIFEKPVIANDSFCIGERVQKFNLGLTVPEGNISKYIEALHCLCEQLNSIEHWLQPDFKGYKAIHATEQPRIALQTILEAAQLNAH